MIKLNRNTKKAQSWLDAEVQGYSLREVYGSYSVNKENAFKECEDLCKEKEGRDLCIIGHNHNYFTVKFTTDAGVYIITYANNYFIAN